MSDESRSIIGDFSEATSDPEVFREIERRMEKWVGDDSSGHDLDHAWRVFNVAVKIAVTEGADIDVVGAASLTHDIHRSMGDPDEYVPPEASLSEVRSILEATTFPREKIPAVLHCVEVHEEYEFRGDENPARTTEALVLQDADNLDAIGAIGIARNFAFTGVVGNRLWAPNTDEYSGLGHFDDKLYHLKDEMNTETARTLAEERHEFLTDFAERFKREWCGER